MRLRYFTTLGVAGALALGAVALPGVASGKLLTEVTSKTKSNPSISGSAFLEFPKHFRIVITASKHQTQLGGSIASVQCSHGENAKTKSIAIKGKPKVNKKVKPSMKHAQACFISVTVQGDRPGRIKLRIEGDKRKSGNDTAAAAPAA
jgi:hypothetical protein